MEKERNLTLKQEKGWSLRAIAVELQCSCFTVRKWWRHERDHKQLRPRGRPGKGILSTYPESLIDKAVEIKQAHPHWGPANVRLELKKELAQPAAKIPSRARLAVLFKVRCREAVQSRQTRAYPEQAPVPSRHPHQRWPVDAQEGLSLIGGEKINILDVRDPCGLAIGSHALITSTEKR
jgi:hypothetical protein